MGRLVVNLLNIDVRSVLHGSVRRLLVLAAMIVAALSLSACSDNEATVRFKVIVDATVDGKPVQGSSVHEVRYTRLKNNAQGYGGRTEEFGEATVVDLGERGTLYVLPRYMLEDRDPRPIFPEGLLDTVGLTRTSTGSLDKEDLKFLRSLKPGQQFELRFVLSFGGQNVDPLMVIFRDATKVETMTQVTRENFSEIFGQGSSFKGITLEITDEPVTKGTAEVSLPLLKDPNLVWWSFSPEERALPRAQRPFVKFIKRDSFYERGSAKSTDGAD